MADIRLMFPNEYLGAPDLLGKDAVLTISKVVQEDLTTKGGDTDRKPIIYFKETEAHAKATGSTEKRLVLNKTNMKTIAAMYGYDADDWKGKRISLFPTTCEAFGETVDCIRVRAQVPKETN